MSDLAALIRTLEAHLPAFRREMADADWAAFAGLLTEAASPLEQAAADPRKRLEAFSVLERAFGRFEVTRRYLPAPGGALVEPSPPPPAEGAVSGLPEGPVGQKEPDLAELLRRAAELCRDPDGAAAASTQQGEER
ncbi:MAG: hypothetical protein RMN52_06525 [Anaerolineae bacterium]|nr:hypothetical protein [Candidatus Roseilinea sp.]MDW8449641.1 hypothetical protein [Anaerolineae bacterium]